MYTERDIGDVDVCLAFQEIPTTSTSACFLMKIHRPEASYRLAQRCCATTIQLVVHLSMHFRLINDINKFNYRLQCKRELCDKLGYSLEIYSENCVCNK